MDKMGLNKIKIFNYLRNDQCSIQTAPFSQGFLAQIFLQVGKICLINLKKRALLSIN